MRRSNWMVCTLAHALGMSVLLASPASAQLGIRGGVNLTDLVGGGVEQSENRSGLSRLGQGDDGPEVKNRGFSLMLGYSFGF